LREITELKNCGSIKKEKSQDEGGRWDRFNSKEKGALEDLKETGKGGFTIGGERKERGLGTQ